MTKQKMCSVDVTPFLDAIAEVSLSQFVDLATRHMTVKQRGQYGRPVPEAASPGVVKACEEAIELQIDLGTEAGPVAVNEAATLIAWLVFKRPQRDPSANQLMAISSSSPAESIQLLRTARNFAADVLETAYRDSTGAGGPDYMKAHRAVFDPDTQDSLGVRGGSRCSVYTRGSQFRATILFQAVATKTTGVDVNLCRLIVRFR